MTDQQIAEIVSKNVEDGKITDAGIVALYEAATPGGSVIDFKSFWMDRVPMAACQHLARAGVPNGKRIAELTGASK
jgi:hypothetical protein